MNKAIRKIEKFLQTDNGQRLLQYGYSFGAAIVIFGAMVKVLHLWGIWGNIIFGTGMAIEVVVFILYGLDQPPKSYKWENVYPALESGDPADRPLFHQGGYVMPQGGYSVASGDAHIPQGGDQQQAAYTEGEQPTGAQPSVAYPTAQPTAQPQQFAGAPHTIPTFSEESLGDLSAISENVIKFTEATETLTNIAGSLQESYRRIEGSSRHISFDTEDYSRQIQELNRNIRELNQIYARMIQAMKPNQD